MTIEDHRRGFTAAMAALHAEGNAYLGRDGADPAADSMGYRQGVFWASPAELAELVDGVLAVIRSKANSEPAPGRRPHLLSMILFPTGEPVPDERPQDERPQNERPQNERPQ
jgi:hypothetical protein